MDIKLTPSHYDMFNTWFETQWANGFWAEEIGEDVDKAVIYKHIMMAFESYAYNYHYNYGGEWWNRHTSDEYMDLYKPLLDIIKKEELLEDEINKIIEHGIQKIIYKQKS